MSETYSPTDNALRAVFSRFDDFERVTIRWFVVHIGGTLVDLDGASMVTPIAGLKLDDGQQWRDVKEPQSLPDNPRLRSVCNGCIFNQNGHCYARPKPTIHGETQIIAEKQGASEFLARQGDNDEGGGENYDDYIFQYSSFEPSNLDFLAAAISSGQAPEECAHAGYKAVPLVSA